MSVTLQCFSHWPITGMLEKEPHAHTQTHGYEPLRNYICRDLSFWIQALDKSQKCEHDVWFSVPKVFTFTHVHIHACTHTHTHTDSGSGVSVKEHKQRFKWKSNFISWTITTNSVNYKLTNHWQIFTVYLYIMLPAVYLWKDFKNATYMLAFYMYTYVHAGSNTCTHTDTHIHTHTHTHRDVERWFKYTNENMCQHFMLKYSVPIQQTRR